MPEKKPVLETDATFEKVTQSEKPLHGPRKLLMCGFPVAAQIKFGRLLEMIGFTDVPVVWAESGASESLLGELMALPDGYGNGVASKLPRAIIAAGITEKELIGLMSACKKSGMAKTLWAALTPTSEHWTLSQLLSELAAENKALRKRS